MAEGEDKTIEGWLVYGRALNEGRAMLASNNKFHDWMLSHQLGGTHGLDRAAAMWAASDESTFGETRRLHPRVRTVRGLHAK